MGVAILNINEKCFFFNSKYVYIFIFLYLPIFPDFFPIRFKLFVLLPRRFFVNSKSDDIEKKFVVHPPPPLVPIHLIFSCFDFPLKI